MNKDKSQKYQVAINILNSFYKNDVDRKNYVDILLSMNNVENLDVCIDSYKTVCKKFKRNISHHYISKKDNFKDDVNTCLNDNILRLLEMYNGADKPSYYKKCLSNLRKCKDFKNHQNKCIDYIRRDANLNLDNEIKIIMDAQKKYYDAIDDYNLNLYKEGTNGYRSTVKNLKDNLKLLKKNGYIICPFEENKLTENNYLEIYSFLITISLFILGVWIPIIWGVLLIVALVYWVSVYFKLINK